MNEIVILKNKLYEFVIFFKANKRVYEFTDWSSYKLADQGYQDTSYEHFLFSKRIIDLPQIKKNAYSFYFFYFETKYLN